MNDSNEPLLSAEEKEKFLFTSDDPKARVAYLLESIRKRMGAYAVPDKTDFGPHNALLLTEILCANIHGVKKNLLILSEGEESELARRTLGILTHIESQLIGDTASAKTAHKFFPDTTSAKILEASYGSLIEQWGKPLAEIGAEFAARYRHPEAFSAGDAGRASFEMDEEEELSIKEAVELFQERTTYKYKQPRSMLSQDMKSRKLKYNERNGEKRIRRASLLSLIDKKNKLHEERARRANDDFHVG